MTASWAEDVIAEHDRMTAEDKEPGAVLDQVRAWLTRFVATMTPGDLDLLALWVVASHVCSETYTTARLLLDSPVPGSGKTTTMEHLKLLCLRPVLMAAVSSSALLVRMLEQGPRTLLIDEADRTLRPDKPETADVLAILNSGYKRGATRPVLVPMPGGGWDTREMPTFAPVALAGNAPNLPADTASRMVRVLLFPDVDGTVEESDWELIGADAEALASTIATWAEVNRERIRTERPPLPPGVTGRFREKWSPLARVAAVEGGRWPEVVADLAKADVEQVAHNREDGMIADRPHVVLLRHIAEAWPRGEPFAATSALVTTLIARWPNVWSAGSSYGRDLTPQRFGRMLAQHFGVNSTHSPDKTHRGYQRASLAIPWRRMGVAVPPGEPSEPFQPSQPSRTPAPSLADGSDASDGPDGSKGSLPDLPQPPPAGSPCPVHGTPSPAGAGCAKCAAHAQGIAL